MLTMSASDVRKDWSAVIDSVVRRRPAFIKRTRDHMILCSAEMMAEIMSKLVFTADQTAEDDGSVTLSLRELDLVVNEKDLASAKRAMAYDIVEYAEEYYNEFELYAATPNRRAHLPYVMKALSAAAPGELEDAVICLDGKN